MPETTPLAPATAALLAQASTATLTSQLLRRGITNTFMAGLGPMHPGQRMVGTARTLRYVPMREDQRGRTLGVANPQSSTIESLGAGDVLVIDARGVVDAASIGDIFAARAQALGAAGIVTDGAVRDTPGVAALGIPVYHRAAHASSALILHHPLERDVPIGCAGVLVLPGDVLVGDGEGVLVIPAALADEVARDAVEQELEEAFALERVRAGEPLVGLYPLGDARRAEYERWREARGGA